MVPTGTISSVTKQIHCVCNSLWWYQQVPSVRLPSKYTAYATVCGGTNRYHQFGYQANTLRMQRSVVVPTGTISSVTKQIHCVCNSLWWYQQVPSVRLPSKYTAYATVCDGANRYHQFGYQANTLRMQRSVVLPTGTISSITKQIHCVCNSLWWYQQIPSVRLPSKYTAYATVCGGTNWHHQFGYQANTLRMQRSVVVPTGTISSVTKQIHCVCNGLWWYQQVSSVRLTSKYTAYATVCGGTNRYHQFGYQANTLRMQRSVVIPTGTISSVTKQIHCVCNGMWWYQ